MLIAMNPRPHHRAGYGCAVHARTTATGGHGIQAIIVVFHLSRRQDFVIKLDHNDHAIAICHLLL